jgi:hypothetical protein
MQTRTKFAAMAAIALMLMTGVAVSFLFYSLNHPADNPAYNSSAIAALSPVRISPAPATGAADIYVRAADLITTDCPANSNLTYPDYPPFGKDWETTEAHAWMQNRAARELARQAISINGATWPDNPSNHFLNKCRALANELGDAALYEHEQGRDADAFQSLGDVLHMGALLNANLHKALINNLVGGGCIALAMQRMMIITSNVSLVAGGQNPIALPVDSARKLIVTLLQAPVAETEMSGILKAEDGDLAAQNIFSSSLNRATETFRRVSAEENLAAMSLACHVFFFHNHRWPASSTELSAQLPGGLPKDPWGNGGQTLGYVLINAGLPDGSDRPLVYNRSRSGDGLFFRIDQPLYNYYVRDGSSLPADQQKHGGQFRDVASWVPGPEKPTGPTTRPLP